MELVISIVKIPDEGGMGFGIILMRMRSLSSDRTLDLKQQRSENLRIVLYGSILL